MLSAEDAERGMAHAALWENFPAYQPTNSEENVLNMVTTAGAGLAGFFFVLNVLFSDSSNLYVGFVLMVCCGGFIYAKHLAMNVISKPCGDISMRRIAKAIQLGSEGFLATQYMAIAKFALATATILFVVYSMRTDDAVALSQGTYAFLTSFSFLAGAFCSALAGYVGVWISVRANIRVAAAAASGSYGNALMISFHAGGFSALLSAALCILGLTVLYVFMYIMFAANGKLKPTQIPLLLVGYGFGASFVALFMQLGGGIYTKAADVGADLVGKVESGLDEDDPRNAAVIADLVGDNVGDCAGSMADVFESIAAEVIGTMMLGSTMASEAHLTNPEPFVFFALIIHSIDIIVSSIGIHVVTPGDSEDPLASMKKGYYVTSVSAVAIFCLATYTLLGTESAPDAWIYFSACGFVGVALANGLVLSTQYYTDYNQAPVREIAEAAASGHGPNIIAGIAVGMESTGFPGLLIAASLCASYVLGASSGIASPNAGLFGTACATMGMLCTAVFVLSMNNFGPIADNAGGIVEMSEQAEHARIITDRLDAVGNVTKAATKGYAVGGSALATFILFRAFLDEVTAFSGLPFHAVDISKVEVLSGGILGIMLVFVFASWSIKAVGITAQMVIAEIKRQFTERPGIMAGEELPDYEACVRIVTKAALAQMFAPAMLALGMPVAVAVVARFASVMTERPLMAAEVLGSFLIFGATTGLMMAVFLDNGGGAWDNAKKYIEQGAFGGKGSEAHKAAVTGDTVGDPFKDTAGPSLHVIITTMSTTALVLGPLVLY